MEGGRHRHWSLVRKSVMRIARDGIENLIKGMSMSKDGGKSRINIESSSVEFR